MVPPRKLKSFARSALHTFGLVSAVRALKSRRLRILIYHRFLEDRSSLVAQCDHLRRNYQPVSMRMVAESLHAGSPLPENAVAITVDDGFRDFLSHAHPVFSTYRIPTTVFVVTDALDGQGWLWFSQVEYMFDRTRRTSIQFVDSEFGIENDRKRAARQVVHMLTRLPNGERAAQLIELQGQLEVDMPDRPPAEHALLTWDEVRELAGEGVEFGSHTRTHPSLSSISSLDALHEEIAGSKKRLDKELQTTTMHFAYPFGTWADFNKATLSIVKSCGFATAVTAESGLNHVGIDPLQLFRLGVDLSFPERRVVELLAGLRKY